MAREGHEVACLGSLVVLPSAACGSRWPRCAAGVLCLLATSLSWALSGRLKSLECMRVVLSVVRSVDGLWEGIWDRRLRSSGCMHEALRKGLPAVLPRA
eukprot:775127-Pelagomonas_calceolata.AAC.1